MDTEAIDFNELKLKPYRKEFSYSYSCGVFPTCELAEKKTGLLKKLILSAKSLENNGVIKLQETCKKHNIPVIVDDKTLARIYPKENVYAIGVFEKREYKLDASANHIVLVNPSDMGNLGTIIRTMVAFGIFDLAIITPAADVFDPKVIRASMGAFFTLRCSRFDSFDDYMQSISGKNVPPRTYYPFILEGAPMETVARPKSGTFSLIFGNEARGLPDEFTDFGVPVRIDHENTVDSLNLPVACSIGIYNFVKGWKH